MRKLKDKNKLEDIEAPEDTQVSEESMKLDAENKPGSTQKPEDTQKIGAENKPGSVKNSSEEESALRNSVFDRGGGNENDITSGDEKKEEKKAGKKRSKASKKDSKASKKGKKTRKTSKRKSSKKENSKEKDAKTAEKSPRRIINIDMIERMLPPKQPRSHHVVVKIDKASKHFKAGETIVRAVTDIDLALYSGEFVIVYGPSGCGKSTFLHMVLGIEEPTGGRIELRGKDLYTMSSDDRTKFRREKIGMVFQQSNWIRSLNVLENVAYPLWLSGYEEDEAEKRALKYLHDVGMERYAKQSPTELSGGQQQRVALARALVTDPWIIIADEPTGNLDTDSSAEIMRLLAWLNREKRRMIIMVTHEMEFLALATRQVGMKDGHIIYDEHD